MWKLEMQFPIFSNAIQFQSLQIQDSFILFSVSYLEETKKANNLRGKNRKKKKKKKRKARKVVVFL